MSVDKNQHEADRWLRTAIDDLEAAVVMRDHGKFAHACFLAQQAAEKALKAACFLRDLDPWGHSVKKLLDVAGPEFAPFAETAMELDRYYVPTRYPNGLPDLIPAEAYGAADAVRAMSAAQTILATAQSLMPPKPRT